MAESEKRTGISVGDLKSLIGELVTDAVKAVSTETGNSGKVDDKNTDKGSSGTASDSQRSSGTSVAEQVKAALAGIKKEEAAAEREKRIDEQLAALSVANKEKVPVERGRFHKWMGWGENES